MEIRSSRYWKHPPPPSPFPHRQYSQTFAQWSLLGNGKASVIYRVTAILKQVNCAENITQLKILGSCPVTAISGIYCIFYSSLYSWRPFVEGRGGGGVGGGKWAATPPNWAAKFLVVSAPFSLLFHRSLSPGRSGGGKKIEKSFFTLPQSLLAS